MSGPEFQTTKTPPPLNRGKWHDVIEKAKVTPDDEWVILETGRDELVYLRACVRKAFGCGMCRSRRRDGGMVDVWVKGQAPT